MKLNGFFDTIKEPTFPQYASGFPEDMDDWSCSQFGLYWQRIKADMGNSINTRATFEGDISQLNPFASCSSISAGSCSLKETLARDGFDIESGIITGLLCDVTGIAKDVTATARSTTKIVSVVVPLLLIGGVLFAVTNPKGFKRLFK